MKKINNQKILESINLNTGEYSSSKVDLKIDKMDITNLINRKDKFGDYAWSVTSK